MTEQEIFRKAIEKAKRNGYGWYGDLFKHWEVIIAAVEVLNFMENDYEHAEDEVRRS